MLDLNKLEKVHRYGRRHIARCPACAEGGGDRKGEHLFIGKDGRFGCVQFPGPDGTQHRKRIFELVGIRDKKPVRNTNGAWPTLDEAIANMERRLGMRATRRDPYHDREGSEHFVVVRFDGANGKDFRPFHRNSSTWVMKDPPGKLPLFGLPELIARPSERVFVVEGEKCACELATLGLLVTTSAHGAKSAHKTDWEPLAGREVVPLPDNDADGQTYAETVAQILSHLSPPAAVQVVELPDLPPKGDCVDWLERRDAQVPEDIRAELESLIARSEKAETRTTSKSESFGYFDAGRNCYWIRNDRGSWISLNETQFKRMLRRQGVSPELLPGAYVSALDVHLIQIQQKWDVHYAGSLAGYSTGIYEIGERRVLVIDSPRIVEPRPGNWRTVKALFDGLLHDATYDQQSYLFGWLKISYETLRARERRPGQALVFAGVHDCGKSLVQNLITEMLGGRSARPHQFMLGLTPFNSDLFEAEHLMIEDEQASTDIRARRNFGTHLKSITVNEWQRCHAKYRVPISLPPFWRLSITVNNEPENLMVLPPIDDSIEDKLIILRASKFPMPMPTATLAQRRAFWQRLIDELPAFVDFLLRWEIPSHLISERFGITHFHHPDILQAINNLAPEYRLLRLIDDELFQFDDDDEWEGSAEQLERRLCGEQSTCRNEARKLFTFNTACGVYLARLHKRYPNRFEPIHAREGNRWTIHPPQSEKHPFTPSQSVAL